MSACCGGNQNFDGTSVAYRRALWAVIAINGSMFLVEVLAGAMGQSMALQADALDFLADTATYALSLFVIGRSMRLRASVALFKGVSLAAMGVGDQEAAETVRFSFGWVNEVGDGVDAAKRVAAVVAELR